MLGRLTLARYNQLAPGITQALQRANCNTVNRAAMFCAQVGTESGGLQWMEELASGAEYEGRTDLGNTHPGDGRRFKGRGPIQITGRHNYTNLSRWAHAKGYVSTATFFVDHPEKLSELQYVWLGPVWYWTVARNMNAYADRGDIRGATLAVNGGVNGLADRTNRWNVCRGIGSALLKGGGPVKPDTQSGHAYTGQDLNAWLGKAGVTELQGILHVTKDGLAGPATVDALEKLAGYKPDHVLDVGGSNTIRKVQARINQQMKTHLATDGIVGHDTGAEWLKYMKAGGKLADLAKQTVPKAPAKPKALPTLQKGSTGATVEKVQAFLLKKFPAYAGPIQKAGGADGKYGNATVSVVKEFQKRSKLTADGIVGAKTYAAMRKLGLSV